LQVEFISHFQIRVQNILQNGLQHRGCFSCGWLFDKVIANLFKQACLLPFNAAYQAFNVGLAARGFAPFG
jgi:hypothetical protein